MSLEIFLTEEFIIQAYIQRHESRHAWYNSQSTSAAVSITQARNLWKEQDEIPHLD
jgi:hypothetical protein